MNTFQLSNSSNSNPPSSSPWDLMVDSNKNIAIATGPLALAQDVASAIQTYLGEVYYDTTQGLPYLSAVLGQPYAPMLLQAQLQQTALTVPGVLLAKASINTFANRMASGVVYITDASGEALGIHF
jgi:hypothetical protein